MSQFSHLVTALDRLPECAVQFAGGKGASLGRMARAGFTVPRGFVVGAGAFSLFLKSEDDGGATSGLAAELDVDDEAELHKVSDMLRDLIVGGPLPTVVEDSIRSAYAELGDSIPVAVRSSAVCEDGNAASFAGQQETYLNVCGADAILQHVKECWASFFSPRALFYRRKKGDLADTQIAVVVQEMIRAEKSGVLFTSDPVNKSREHMVVEAVFGLGEGIVSGLLTPNHYVLERGEGLVVREFLTNQRTAIVHDPHRGGTMQVKLAATTGTTRVLSSHELAELHRVGLRLEELFAAPQDVEWCIEGKRLLLLQSRPITTLTKAQ